MVISFTAKLFLSSPSHLAYTELLQTVVGRLLQHLGDAATLIQRAEVPSTDSCYLLGGEDTVHRVTP